MSLGPAGVFGLSHLGNLRKLVGKSFRDLGSDRIYQRILAVGRKHVWLQSAADELVLVNARNGAAKVLEQGASEHMAFDIDTVTDDLAWSWNGKFYRVSAKTGEVTEVR
jgi:hypothetical protein